MFLGSSYWIKYFKINLHVTLCFRAIHKDIKGTTYRIEQCHEALSVGMKASEAFQEARKLFQEARELFHRQRHNSAASDEIDLNIYRSPPDLSPGLIGEISCNLKVFDLLLGTEEMAEPSIKDGTEEMAEPSIKDSFSRHLLRPSDKFDVSSLFQGCKWYRQTYLDYIKNLMGSTQKCLMTLGKKICYEGDAGQTIASFKSLSMEYHSMIVTASIQNWQKNRTKWNPMEKVLSLRQCFAPSLFDSFEHVINNKKSLKE